MKPKVVYKGVGGLTVWQVPDSVFQILWAGPGAGLMFGEPMKAGGLSTRIDHPTADGQYSTRKEAEAAVRAFIEAASTTEKGT